MRFADPFKISEALAPAQRLEAERLMFLELTQGSESTYIYSFVILTFVITQYAFGATLPISRS